MWSETFTDSFGNKWTVRRAEEWETVQLLVTGPDFEAPFSYGLKPTDYSALLELLERGRMHGLELPRRTVYAIHCWRDETRTEYCGSWHIPAVDEDEERIAELRRAGFGLAGLPEGIGVVRAFFHEDELAAQVKAASETLKVYATPEVVHYRAGTDKGERRLVKTSAKPWGGSPDERESGGQFFEAELQRIREEELAAGRDPRD